MSSDLDKLMKHMVKPNTEIPQETKVVEEDVEEDDFDEEDEEIVKEKPAQKVIEEKKDEELHAKEPAQVEIPESTEDQENSINAEVGLLQNAGIFRRELLLTLKELVDVQKAHAEILIQLKKELKK